MADQSRAVNLTITETLPIIASSTEENAALTQYIAEPTGVAVLPRNPYQILTHDVWLLIFRHLDPRTLVTLGLVCRDILAISNDAHIWKLHLNFEEYTKEIEYLKNEKKYNYKLIYYLFPLLRKSEDMSRCAEQLKEVWPELLSIPHPGLPIPLEQFNNAPVTRVINVQVPVDDTRWFNQPGKAELISLLKARCFIEDPQFLQALLICATKYNLHSISCFTVAFMFHLEYLNTKNLTCYIKSIVINTARQTEILDPDVIGHLVSDICSLDKLSTNNTINLAQRQEFLALITHVFANQQWINIGRLRILPLIHHMGGWHIEHVDKLITCLKKHGFAFAFKFVQSISAFILDHCWGASANNKDFTVSQLFLLVEREGFNKASKFFEKISPFRSLLNELKIWDLVISKAIEHGSIHADEFVEIVSRNIFHLKSLGIWEIFLTIAQQDGFSVALEFRMAYISCDLERHPKLLTELFEMISRKNFKQGGNFLSLLKDDLEIIALGKLTPFKRVTNALFPVSQDNDRVLMQPSSLISEALDKLLIASLLTCKNYNFHKLYGHIHTFYDRILLLQKYSHNADVDNTDIQINALDHIIVALARFRVYTQISLAQTVGFAQAYNLITSSNTQDQPLHSVANELQENRSEANNLSYANNQSQKNNQPKPLLSVITTQPLTIAPATDLPFQQLPSAAISSSSQPYIAAASSSTQSVHTTTNSPNTNTHSAQNQCNIFKAPRPSETDMQQLDKIMVDLSREIKVERMGTSSISQLFGMFSLMDSNQGKTNSVNEATHPTVKEAKHYFLTELKKSLTDIDKQAVSVHVLVELTKARTQLIFPTLCNLDVTEGVTSRVSRFLEKIEKNISIQLESNQDKKEDSSMPRRMQHTA